MGELIKISSPKSGLQVYKIELRDPRGNNIRYKVAIIFWQLIKNKMIKFYRKYGQYLNKLCNSTEAPQDQLYKATWSDFYLKMCEQ